VQGAARGISLLSSHISCVTLALTIGHYALCLYIKGLLFNFVSNILQLPDNTHCVFWEVGSLVLCIIILCYIILYYIILYCIILYILYCILLYYIILYYIILYYIILYYVILYYIIISYYIIFIKKPVPLQAWSGPEGSRKLRFPDFMTTAQEGGKVVSLTHRPPLPPGNAPGTHFCILYYIVSYNILYYIVLYY